MRVVIDSVVGANWVSHSNFLLELYNTLHDLSIVNKVINSTDNFIYDLVELLLTN